MRQPILRRIKETIKNIANVGWRYEVLQRQTEELLYAHRYHDAINGCQWLPRDGLNISLSGGSGV